MTLEQTLRLKMEKRGFSKDMIDYWMEYSKSPKGNNNNKEMKWIIGFGEFIETKIGNKLLKAFDIESVPSSCEDIDDIIIEIKQKVNVKWKKETGQMNLF